MPLVNNNYALDENFAIMPALSDWEKFNQVLQALVRQGAVKSRRELVRQALTPGTDKAQIKVYDTGLRNLATGRQKTINGILLYRLVKVFDLSLEWWYEGTGSMFTTYSRDLKQMPPHLRRQIVESLFESDPALKKQIREFINLPPDKRAKVLELLR